MPPATASMATLALVSERVRKIPRRTSGAFERSSVTTNPASSASATRPARPSVSTASQP